MLEGNNSIIILKTLCSWRILYIMLNDHPTDKCQYSLALNTDLLTFNYCHPSAYYSSEATIHQVNLVFFSSFIIESFFLFSVCYMYTYRHQLPYWNILKVQLCLLIWYPAWKKKCSKSWVSPYFCSLHLLCFLSSCPH